MWPFNLLENGTYQCQQYTTQKFAVKEQRSLVVSLGEKVLDKSVVLFQNGAFVIIATDFLQVRSLTCGRGKRLIQIKEQVY